MEKKYALKEDLEISLKRLLKDFEIFKRKGTTFVLDVETLLETELEIYEEIVSSPLDFVKNLKRIIKETYGAGFKLKLRNFNNVETISNLRIQHLGKIFKVKGMIGKTNKTLALVDFSFHECYNCGVIIKIKDGGKPGTCSCGNSNPRKFKFLKNEYRNLQEIEIEESQDELDDRQPQKIRVRLLDELTDSEMTGQLQPGNKVEVVGVVEAIPINNRRIDEEIYEYRIHCLDIINLEDQSEEEALTEDDIRQIEDYSVRDDILDLMANSVAPEIIGLTEIKKSLVLQQVGGVKKKLSDGKFTRDRIHILLIGDAGLSKTQLGKNICLRTPKSFYTSGEQATSAGLTATVERDELTGSWGLKAGAMCKANESILVADEIDKAGEQTLKALHTPLESGIIPVSKAGINTKLRAECSLLALANPKGGRFEIGGNKTLVDQINMPPTLLSRFDLIHVVRDEIDEKKDNQIIDYICSGDDLFEEIPVELYRKYITYAKKIRPSFPKERVEELKKFYNQIRKKSLSEDSKLSGMPITPRNIQGIIRMAEASAKIRLSETVEKEDLELAQKLYYDSLLKIGMDEEGTIDFARIGSGKTLSRKKKSNLLFEHIRSIYTDDRPLSDKRLKEWAIEKGFQESEYNDIMFDLNREGYIIKNEGGWKVV